MKIDEFGFTFNGVLSSTEITRFINVGFDISPAELGVGLIRRFGLILQDKNRNIILQDFKREVEAC